MDCRLTICACFTNGRNHSNKPIPFPSNTGGLTVLHMESRALSTIGNTAYGARGPLAAIPAMHEPCRM